MCLPLVLTLRVNRNIDVNLTVTCSLVYANSVRIANRTRMLAGQSINSDFVTSYQRRIHVKSGSRDAAVALY